MVFPLLGHWLLEGGVPFRKFQGVQGRARRKARGTRERYMSSESPQA